MKKYLLFLTISLVNILFIENISAADYALQINSEDIPKNYFYTLEQIPSDYQDQIETAYNYFGIDYENDNYIISYDTLNKDLICFKWNKDISYKIEPSVAFKRRTSTQWIMHWFVSLNGEGYYYKYDFRDTINNVKQTTTGNSDNMIIYSTSSSSSSYELTFSSYGQCRLIESTVDFKFSDYVYGDTSYPRATSLSICDTELCYPVLLDSIIFTKTLEPNWVDKTPSVDYQIEIDENEFLDNNKKLYNIYLTYENMSDEYYSVYYNLKDGTTKYIGTGEELTNYEINYVNDDAIITIYIYNKNDEMVNYTTIDLENINLDLSQPYIFIMGYNQKQLPNSVAYQYKNTNDEDNKCYYKFGGGELTQESCSTDEIKLRNSSYNTSLSLMIYDNNNNILSTKTVNLNFITGYPRLEFETYYSDFVKGQILNIKMYDYQENDTLFYSINNVDFKQLGTQELNSLTFFENTAVYFKIYRNNEIIADSYYYVKMGNYSISISENNTLDEIKELTESSSGHIKNFLGSINENLNLLSDLIQYFYDGLDSNIKSFLVAVFSLIVICAIILLARK